MSGRGAAPLALITLAYPFAVFFALRRGESAVLWVMAALGLVLGAVRLRAALATRDGGTSVSSVSLWLPVAMPVLMTVAALVSHFAAWPDLTLLWPVLVNLGFLWTFASSLRTVPLVERLARLQDPGLSAPKAAHCRTVTQVWCGFFVVNAVVITALALAHAIGWWTLYTGVISYVLMGFLFSVELVVRHARFGWDVSLPSRLGLRLWGHLRRRFAR